MTVKPFFSADALKQSNLLRIPVKNPTKLPTAIAIDPIDAKEVDDAFWIEARDKDYLVNIYIVDITAWITKDDPIETEARQRIETIFAQAYNLPLYPPELSHQKASLIVGAAKPALALQFKLDLNWQLIDYKLECTTVKIIGNYSYSQVLNQELPSHIYQVLSYGSTLAQLLWRQRHQERNSEEQLEQMNKYRQNIRHRLNQKMKGMNEQQIENCISAYFLCQELMIWANKLMATYCQEQQIPIIYRNHGNTEKSLSPKAYYSLESHGHSELNANHYARFTSPLRRYLDTVNLINLISYLENQSINKGTLTKTYDVIELRQILKDSIAHEQQRSTAQNFNPTDLERINSKQLSKLIINYQPKNDPRQIRKNSLLNAITSKIDRGDASYKLIATAVFVRQWQLSNLTAWINDYYADILQLIPILNHFFDSEEVQIHEYSYPENNLYISIFFFQGIRAQQINCAFSNKQAKKQALIDWLTGFANNELVEKPWLPHIHGHHLIHQKTETVLVPEQPNSAAMIDQICTQLNLNCDQPKMQQQWVGSLNLYQGEEIVYTGTGIGNNKAEAIANAQADIIHYLSEHDYIQIVEIPIDEEYQ